MAIPFSNIIPNWLTNVNPGSFQTIATNITSLKQMDIIGVITIVLALINIFFALAWIMELQARKRRR